MKSKSEILGDRLINYAMALRQTDLVVAEMQTSGFVTEADRERWEKLIVPERLRIAAMMKTLGISPLQKLPSIEAAKTAAK